MLSSLSVFAVLRVFRFGVVEIFGLFVWLCMCLSCWFIVASKNNFDAVKLAENIKVELGYNCWIDKTEL